MSIRVVIDDGQCDLPYFSLSSQGVIHVLIPATTAFAILSKFSEEQLNTITVCTALKKALENEQTYLQQPGHHWLETTRSST